MVAAAAVAICVSLALSTHLAPAPAPLPPPSMPTPERRQHSAANHRLRRRHRKPNLPQVSLMLMLPLPLGRLPERRPQPLRMVCRAVRKGREPSRDLPLDKRRRFAIPLAPAEERLIEPATGCRLVSLPIISLSLSLSPYLSPFLVLKSIGDQNAVQMHLQKLGKIEMSYWQQRECPQMNVALVDSNALTHSRAEESSSSIEIFGCCLH